MIIPAFCDPIHGSRTLPLNNSKVATLELRHGEGCRGLRDHMCSSCQTETEGLGGPVLRGSPSWVTGPSDSVLRSAGEDERAVSRSPPPAQVMDGTRPPQSF